MSPNNILCNILQKKISQGQPSFLLKQIHLKHNFILNHDGFQIEKEEVVLRRVIGSKKDQYFLDKKMVT